MYEITIPAFHVNAVKDFQEKYTDSSYILTTNDDYDCVIVENPDNDITAFEMSAEEHVISYYREIKATNFCNEKMELFVSILKKQFFIKAMGVEVTQDFNGFYVSGANTPELIEELYDKVNSFFEDFFNTEF